MSYSPLPVRTAAGQLIAAAERHEADAAAYARAAARSRQVAAGLRRQAGAYRTGLVPGYDPEPDPDSAEEPAP